MSRALRVCHGTFGRVALLELDRPLVAHAHPQGHLLIKLDGIDTGFRVRGRPLRLDDHSAVHVRPWELHDFPHGALPHTALVLALYFDDAWLGGCLSGGTLAGSALALDTHARALAAAVAHTMLASASADVRGMESALAALLAQLPQVASPLPPAEQAIDRRLRRVLHAIDERLGQDLDFAKLAGEAGLSRAHLFTLFRRDIGLPPGVYVNTLRMAYALRAMERDKDAIGAVALDLGFSAQSNFTRFFRDIQGVAPNDYRRARSSAMNQTPG